MSFVDDILSPTEKKFLKLVEEGDIDGLKNLFKTKKQLNFDCCDYKGRRALDIAIKKRDVAMHEFLLQELKISNLHFYCAMLTAVLENDVYFLETLLDRVGKTENLEHCMQCLVGGGPQCLRYLPEVASSNLTPLMVAALERNIEITKMFLERGYLVKKPHLPNCICTCCATRAKTGETLTESMSRINTYRTLASPTYLILTTSDPILAAFQLSYELEKLSNDLPEHQKEYKDLSRKCSLFAADLLDECRTTEEVKTLLSQRLGCPDNRPEMLNRFVTAVHYGQKEFVTHPNCQQVLRSIWVEGLPWYSWTTKTRVLHVLKHSLLMPIICIAYSFAPKAKRMKALNIPINRFIYFTSSYCVFLFLLLFTLLCDRFSGSIKALVTESLVGLWILGFFLDLLLKCWNGYLTGIGCWYKTYCYDFTMSLLFVISEIIFVLSLSGVLKGPKDRREMCGYDPVLVGDAIYAIASIMAFCRLIIWCKLNCKLGPLTVSLKHMLGDVSRFFVLFSVIVIAFSIGMNSIYKYYENSEQCTRGGSYYHHGNEFQTLFQTGNNLFWAIFGKGEPYFADIYNCQNKTNGQFFGEITVDENRHYFTEAIGYGMWGMYHFIACLVILNMLIGMMAESYQRVQENADMEWKFACSTLWLSVFDVNCLVPPPFNLLPSLQWFITQYKWMRQKRKAGYLTSSEKMEIIQRCEKEKKEKKCEDEKYEKLMVQLIKRYLHSNGLKESAVASASTHRYCWKAQNHKKRSKSNDKDTNLS
ncbi:short transient receptor potential channel 4 [Caerostris darwini]|uniref:Short transient receptor potential channel 4 n=1 Tax=Caerostris darwini TaxID=1538125 RepID=A0AAV4X3Y1_9ARAC|nr:short transient receptor potential channel 4 [Caerostris darwini]